MGGSDLCKSRVSVLYNRNLETLFLFAAIDCKHSVRGDFGYFFAVVGVHLVNASLFLFGIDLLSGYFRFVFEKLAQRLSQLRVVGNHFGDYIRRALDCLLGAFHALFGVYKRLGKTVQIPVGNFLSVYKVGKRLKPLFYRNRRAGLFLLLEGTVNVLHLRERLRALQSRRDLVGHLSLLGDGIENLFLSFCEIAQISQPVGKLSEHLVVARIVHFLSVTSNKGNGVPLVNKRYDVYAVNFLQIKFSCQLFR